MALRQRPERLLHLAAALFPLMASNYNGSQFDGAEQLEQTLTGEGCFPKLFRRFACITPQGCSTSCPIVEDSLDYEIPSPE